jgi:hypothetical protein
MTADQVLKENIETLLNTGEYPVTYNNGNIAKAEELEAKNKEAKKTFEARWNELYTDKTLIFKNEQGEEYQFSKLIPDWRNNSGFFSVYAENKGKTVFNLIEEKKPVALTHLNVHLEAQGPYFGLQIKEYFEEHNIKATPETEKLLQELDNYRI